MLCLWPLLGSCVTQAPIIKTDALVKQRQWWILEIFALTLGALTDTIFRYAFHLCLFGHLYSQNLIPLSDHHTAWLATGTTSYETLTWPGTAFLIPDFSSMTLPFLPLYPKPQGQIGSVSLLWTASPQVYWAGSSPKLTPSSRPQVPTASSGWQQGTHKLCPTVLGSHHSDGTNKWGSLRCPRYGGGEFCPEATTGINSQSVGTTSEDLYGGLWMHAS